MPPRHGLLPGFDRRQLEHHRRQRRPNTNFTSDSAGTTNTQQIPGATTDVHFYATNANTANLATTLGQNFTIKSLTLDGGALSQDVSIASGGAGGNTLTIAPAAATAGITLNSGRRVA